MHSIGEGNLSECSVGDNIPCLHAATDHGTAGCPQAVQISITVVEVASGEGHA